MALWRIRATVDDRPGYLSVLTASLALRSVNILTVQVHATEAGAVDEFLVDAPGYVFPVSFEDTGSGIWATAIAAIVLGFGSLRTATGRRIAQTALICGLASFLVDIYLY